jgi:adenylate cyclase class IV
MEFNIEILTYINMEIIGERKEREELEDKVQSFSITASIIEAVEWI